MRNKSRNAKQKWPHSASALDLPGVGAQSVVSEVLSGKRQLNVRQIRWLAEHFKVPVEMFI